MPIQIQTDFIPKKAPAVASPTLGFRGRSINLLAVSALGTFCIIAGLAGFVFFYKSHLVRTVNDMDVSLAKAKKKIEPEFIDKAVHLSARIESAQELLTTHRALSPLFDVLEKKTLKAVRFQDFNFNASGGRDSTILMTGQAKSFNAVALQSDVFGAERSFKDPVFSNFTLNERGDVIFNFKTTVDPALLLYRETVLGGTTGQTEGEEEDFSLE